VGVICDTSESWMISAVSAPWMRDEDIAAIYVVFIARRCGGQGA
jgi:hypothetical protein